MNRKFKIQKKITKYKLTKNIVKEISIDDVDDAYFENNKNNTHVGNKVSYLLMPKNKED